MNNPAQQRDPVILQIGSQRHQGWQEVRIRRSLESMADQFELVLTERWGDGGGIRPVSPGERCTVQVGSELVLTGHIDDVLPEYDAENHSIVVNGRSLAADLIDCSRPDIRFDGKTLAEIAGTLCKTFGIEVVDEAGELKPFRYFALEDGQPLAEALERAAQIRGVRLVSDAEGRLVIAHAQRREVTPPLVLGANILSAAGQFSDRDRFNQYVIEGQTPGDDDWHGSNAAAPRGRAQDPRVRAGRSTLIVSDMPADGPDCTARAELEARMRWARGRGVTYIVGTWRSNAGVWRPGDRVAVRDAYLGLNETLLISDVQLIEDSQGRRAELRVVPPAAFEPVPVPEPEPPNSTTASWG